MPKPYAPTINMEPKSMKWLAVTRGGSQAWEIELGSFTLEIHQPIGISGVRWCAYSFGILDTTWLNNWDTEKDKDEALDLFMKTLQSAIDEAKKALCQQE